ncbi:MAG TPA: hypothetical protein VNQ14_14575 [Woeseiaceae bacterium]|nr:hypothetical protein [Woeseiaceae bacterium]
MAHDIETVRNALKSVVPELHARANVVATGVGHKVSGGERTTDLSIVCSVTQKLGAAELPPADLIPPEVNGVPTDVDGGEFPDDHIADLEDFVPILFREPEPPFSTMKAGSWDCCLRAVKIRRSSTVSAMCFLPWVSADDADADRDFDNPAHDVDGGVRRGDLDANVNTGSEAKARGATHGN